MRRLLHSDFLEFGRSGGVYDLTATLAAEAAPFEASLPLPGFTVAQPATGVALITYIGRVGSGGGEELGANRSSLWIHDGDRWRIRFHQGTPI